MEKEHQYRVFAIAKDVTRQPIEAESMKTKGKALLS